MTKDNLDKLIAKCEGQPQTCNLIRPTDDYTKPRQCQYLDTTRKYITKSFEVYRCKKCE